ncbi:RTA1-domain-containing protein [Polyporus arcularius HHB13444]|uniref:RTA1-domain-containing protein n=1 Tax=Polyporus arcularius HHB13444 TaxID=1314778 RepID=A0A5C3PGE4_9APHY|nr:RTA1-domain-containing protein [Polyporus arcularius HHB13444]
MFPNATLAAVPAQVTFTPRVSPYGYIPTQWICILFIVLFSLTTLIHLAQAFYSRLWWLLGTTVLAGITEVIGWSGRTWSSVSPWAIDPFLMQITTTIIAPTPLIAANFVILGEIIKRLGQQYSRLSAMSYTIIFCSCDIIALVIQAVGGAKASIALQTGNGDPEVGGHIMLGGIVFQLVAFCIYLALAAEFLLRYHKDKPVRLASSAPPKSFALTRDIKLMIVGLALDGIFILIRSIYRTIELSDGWTGRIISTQVYFNVLDGAMIVLAMYTLNVFHPGFLLGRANVWSSANKTPSEADSDIPEMKARSRTGARDV